MIDTIFLKFCNLLNVVGHELENMDVSCQCYTSITLMRLYIKLVVICEWRSNNRLLKYLHILQPQKIDGGRFIDKG